MDYEEQIKQTEEALENPLVGDKFTYNFSEAIYIVCRQGDLVVSVARDLDGGIWRFQTLKEFKYQFFWPLIKLTERGVNVEGWWKNRALLILANEIRQLKDHIKELEYSVTKLQLKDEGWTGN